MVCTAAGSAAKRAWTISLRAAKALPVHKQRMRSISAARPALNARPGHRDPPTHRPTRQATWPANDPASVRDPSAGGPAPGAACRRDARLRPWALRRREGGDGAGETLALRLEPALETRSASSLARLPGRSATGKGKSEALLWMAAGGPQTVCLCAVWAPGDRTAGCPVPKPGVGKRRLFGPSSAALPRPRRVYVEEVALGEVYV